MAESRQVDGAEEPPARGSRFRRHGRNAVVVAAATALIGALSEQVVTETWEKLFPSEPELCAEQGCDGVNPKTTDCGKDTKTFHPTERNPAQLDIRYSEKCGVVWGRVLAGEPHDEVSVRVADGSTRRAKIAYGHDKFTATAAVGENFEVKVCTEPDAETNPQGRRKAYCITATESSGWIAPVG